MRRFCSALLMLLVLLPLCFSCSRRVETAPWLAEALSTHRQADAQLGRGELDEARTSLLKLVQGSAPEGLAHADYRAIRQDGYFRLVDLELTAARPAEALAWADRGLALGDEGDLFAANLLVGRGRALEGLGRDREAALAYEKALQINERLLQAALSEDPKQARQGERSKG